MKYIITLLSVCWAGLLFGQQISQLSTTGDFLKSYNPAQISENYFLFENTTSIDAVYRAQWLDIEGHPVTQIISYENLYETRSMFSLLFGGRLINDQTGPTGMFGGNVSVAGLYSEDPYYGAIALGLSFGAVQYRVETSEFRPRHAGDIMTLDNRKSTHPDVGFGVSFYKRMRNNWLDDGYVWGGLSAPQILSSRANFDNGDNGEFSFKKLPHIVAFGGFQKYFATTAMVQPTLLVRYVRNAPVNLDFNVKYFMPELLWMGLGASSNQSILTEVGVILGENVGLVGDLRIGYHLGYSLRDYGASVGTIHEFRIGFSFE